ncbi:MAG: hypothetical protein JWM47_2100 [Acidimicrobiales bacterium]|nr:hypothetical protein [Acidimicrobiales bacterium]
MRPGEGEGVVARSGIAVDEVIECPHVGSGVASERLLGLASGQYRAVAVGANRFQFARTYRPSWAVVLGVVLAPTLFGLLFFLIRSTESWTATVEEDHRSVGVRVSGRVLPAVLIHVREGLNAHRDAIPTAAASGVAVLPVHTPAGVMAPPVTPMVPAPAPPWNGVLPLPPNPPPGRLPPAPRLPAAPVGLPGGAAAARAFAPPPGQAGLLAPPGARVPDTGSVAAPSIALSPPVPPAGGASADSVPAPQRAVVEDPLEATHLASAVRGEVTPALMLRFDTGERHPAAPLVLIGRDPAAGKGDVDPVLVAIDDVDRTVSKTHIAVRRAEEGLWVLDRGSTNGSVVESDDGERTDLLPRTAMLVKEGWTVRFGHRSFTVEADA